MTENPPDEYADLSGVYSSCKWKPQPAATGIDLFRLESQLQGDTISMNGAFAALVSKTRDSLASRIEPDILAAAMTKMNLPEEVCHKIDSARSVSEIFSHVNHSWSWFNYHLLEEIIDDLGDQNDHERLANYTQKFAEYGKKRVFELPSDAFQRASFDNNEDEVELTVKVDGNLEEYCVKDADTFCSTLASVLGVRRHLLRLVSVRDGCVLLTFLIPRSMAQPAFSLSISQMTSLRDRGVMELECDGYQQSLGRRNGRTTVFIYLWDDAGHDVDNSDESSPNLLAEKGRNGYREEVVGVANIYKWLETRNKEVRKGAEDMKEQDIEEDQVLKHFKTLSWGDFLKAHYQELRPKIRVSESTCKERCEINRYKVEIRMDSHQTGSNSVSRRVLQNFHFKLRNELDVPQLLPYLNKYHLITPDIHEQLLTLPADHGTKVDRLLAELPRRGERFLQLFIKCLRESVEQDPGTSHGRIADALEEELKLQNTSVFLDDLLLPDWHSMGLQLGLSPGLMDSTKVTNLERGDPRLNKMLSQWLQEKQKHPPTWRRLVNALEYCDLGSHLAPRLKEEHCSWNSDNMVNQQD